MLNTLKPIAFDLWEIIYLLKKNNISLSCSLTIHKWHLIQFFLELSAKLLLKSVFYLLWWVPQNLSTMKNIFSTFSFVFIVLLSCFLITCESFWKWKPSKWFSCGTFLYRVIGLLAIYASFDLSTSFYGRSVTLFIWKVTSRSNIQNLCQTGLVKSLMFTRCQMENILRHFLLNKGLAPPSCKSEYASSKQMLSTLDLILCFVFSLQFVSLGSTEITGQPWTCVQLRQSTQSARVLLNFMKHFLWMIILVSGPWNSVKWQGSAFSHCFWATWTDHCHFEGNKREQVNFKHVGNKRKTSQFHPEVHVSNSDWSH